MIVIIVIILFCGIGIATFAGIEDGGMGVFIFALTGFLFVGILQISGIMYHASMWILLLGPLPVRLIVRYIRKKQAEAERRMERERREREQWERDIDSQIDNIFR
jgi:hypothetical protein